jgi:HlyD family type I secretion membrane fusion protein
MSWSADDAAEIEALSAPKREGRVGLWVAGAFFVGLLGWAALTPLEAGAVAQGQIAVSGNRQVVQHQFGGVITALNVQEGQTVRKGDVLAQIAEGQLVAAERGMTGELFTLYAQRARIEAELNHNGAVQTPLELGNLPAGDQALAEQAMRSQRALFDARRNAQSSERSVLQQRVLQHRSTIDATQNQITANREQKRLIGEELDGLQEMAAKGYVPKNRVRAIQRAAAELDGNFGALRADVAKSNEAIGETHMQITSLGSQMIQDSASEMRDVLLRIGEVQPKLFATREQLTQAYIRATASGKVVGLQVHTVGGVVAPGMTLMEIVPQNRDLVIEAKLSPTDADDVRPGMETQIRFSGVQDRSLPVLYGKVSKVSADSIEDQRSGLHFFTMEVTVPDAELEKIRAAHKGISLTAGLPADVMVKLRSRTALGYLFEPLSKMLWTAGHEQ